MRLYHRGVAFFKKMRGKLSKISEKQNIRDHKCRLHTAKYELRRKLNHRYKLSKLPRKSSFARVRNRCIYTGRLVLYMIKISGILFCGLASRGPLMGIKKSSW